MGAIEWKGNRRSTFATLGASNHTEKEREAHDFYASSPIAIDLLKTKYEIPHYIYEPCAGMGHLAKRLIEHGHDVLSTDLYDRGYTDCYSGVDFMEARWPLELPTEDSCILTNLPYRFLCDMIKHAIEIAPTDDTPLIFLCKTITLESKERYERLFEKGYLHHVFQFVERIQCAKNGDFDRAGQSAIAYAWLVFKRKPCVLPTIQWLTRKDLKPEITATTGSVTEPKLKQLSLFE